MLTARLNTTRTEGGDHAMRVTPHARRYDWLAAAQTLPIAVRSDSWDFLLVAKHRKVTIRSFCGKENHHELSIRWILMISQSP